MEEFDACIEMLAGSSLKHVYNEKRGKLVVHRKSAFPLPKNFNYGFIKGTLSHDGDPLDVFVMSSKRLRLGSTVKARAIGLLYVKDETGIDNKIMAVDSSDKTMGEILELSMLDREKLNSLIYMLEHNKDGLKGKWTKGLFNWGQQKSALGNTCLVQEFPEQKYLKLLPALSKLNRQYLQLCNNDLFFY